MGNNHLHQTCTAAKLWRISPHDPQATVPALRINGGIRAIADIGRAFKLNMVIDHRYGLLVPPVVEEPPAQTSPQSHTPKKSFCAHQASLNELQRSPSESGSPAHNRDACEVYRDGPKDQKTCRVGASKRKPLQSRVDASKRKRLRESRRLLCLVPRAKAEPAKIPRLEAEVHATDFSASAPVEATAPQPESDRRWWADACGVAPAPKVLSTKAGKDLKIVTSTTSKGGFVVEVANATD